MKSTFDLDTCLINFSSLQGDIQWTIREAVEGVQVFGGIGSGKTSGSARTLALKYLANGFGGLVLTVKREERAMWVEYCRLTNRSRDLLIIKPGGKYRFNFLEYVSSRGEGELSITANIVQVLKTVIRAGEEKGGGGNDDQFWETSLDMLISNVIDLCVLAYDKASVQQINDIASTAPKKPEGDNSDKGKGQTKNAFSQAMAAAQKKVKRQIDALEQRLSPEKRKLMENPDIFEQAITDEIPDARLLKSIDQFFIETYRDLSDKTRSIIDHIFSGFLFHLLKDPVYSLFCRHQSNIEPEDCLKGKIILIDLPVKIYDKVGRDCQILFKYIWQRAMEKREIDKNGRPVFLWADEAQHFLHEHDAEYQATARSSRIATVYISQNLPNYFGNMGGQKSHYRVKSFLGTLGTKIFHANADIDTNRYASELIGKAYTRERSTTETVSGNFSSSETESHKLEDMVRAEEFPGLQTGGSKNNYQVEGYIHLQSVSFPNGFNYKKVRFNQNFIP